MVHRPKNTGNAEPHEENSPGLLAMSGPKPGTVLLVANATLLVDRGVHNGAPLNWQFRRRQRQDLGRCGVDPLASTEVVTTSRR
jgi:hypothetical protein